MDVLEVPISTHGNRYLLVMQDYFTKWAEAFPMPDQTAKHITDISIGLCATMGVPRIIHSDQGRNLESAILHQTLQAFGVTKSHISAYHPQRDGIVEQLSRSILQMLRMYVTKQAKLAKLKHIVKTNIVHAASNQKSGYDYGSRIRAFGVDHPVWLLVPCQGKLHSKWQGGWKVKALRGTVNIEISNEKGHRKVIHINRVQHRIQPPDNSSIVNRPTTNVMETWSPPQTKHIIIPCDVDPPSSSPANCNTSQWRYPLRNRQPPDHLQL